MFVDSTYRNNKFNAANEGGKNEEKKKKKKEFGQLKINKLINLIVVRCVVISKYLCECITQMDGGIKEKRGIKKKEEKEKEEKKKCDAMRGRKSKASEMAG